MRPTHGRKLAGWNFEYGIIILIEGLRSFRIKCQDVTQNYAITASFHIPPDSSFTIQYGRNKNLPPDA
jgi:hypothetical protein